MRERERHTKRFKALDDCDIIALMGLLLTDTAKPNAEGSTTRDKGGGAGEAK